MLILVQTKNTLVIKDHLLLLINVGIKVHGVLMMEDKLSLRIWRWLIMS